LQESARGSRLAAMRIALLLLSLASAGLSVAFLGPVLSVPLLLSAALVVAAVLWLVAGRRRREAVPWIVVDGSNVMYWEGEKPSLVTVRRVLAAVQEAGFVPLVWFDANVGYLTQGAYLRPEQLSRMLGLARGQVLVAPKGTPADPLLLEEAVRLGTRVVTNDRFRDWAEDHPAVKAPGFLVGGTMSGGQARLRLGEGAKVA
jgi:hypothetical protein